MEGATLGSWNLFRLLAHSKARFLEGFSELTVAHGIYRLFLPLWGRSKIGRKHDGVPIAKAKYSFHCKSFL